jgi:hypothetical protein
VDLPSILSLDRRETPHTFTDQVDLFHGLPVSGVATGRRSFTHLALVRFGSYRPVPVAACNPARFDDARSPTT